MILIKEVTIENHKQFQGLPSNIIVTPRDASKEFNIGMLVSELGTDSMEFSIILSNGYRTRKYRSLRDLIFFESDTVRFFYIHIKA